MPKTNGSAQRAGGVAVDSIAANIAWLKNHVKTSQAHLNKCTNLRKIIKPVEKSNIIKKSCWKCRIF